MTENLLDHPTGLQPVAILHIDTVGSREFFSSFEVNAAQKCDCQRVLENLFSECCREGGGYAAPNWQGDGGHAFFLVQNPQANFLKAAQAFVSNLGVLAQQTATIIGSRATALTAQRKFRIKVHFGLVYLTPDGKCDAAPSKDFDAFLKYEKDLAPIPDEIFIMEQLREQLSSDEKLKFARFIEQKDYGELKTSVYRMKLQTSNHGRQLLESKRSVKDVSQKELDYLIAQICAQRLNVAARNSITLGLIAAVTKDGGGALNHQLFTKLTLRAMYRYLRAVYPNQKFHVCMWRLADGPEASSIVKSDTHPSETTSSRELRLEDVQFQAVKAFNTCHPVVTESVSEARLAGQWVDFHPSHRESSRHLHSAIQFPVYRVLSENPPAGCERETLGVLSIDCDRPQTFLNDELDLWTSDLTGFLANLALAEHIRRSQLVG